ncbi:MAG: hypothetical protein LC808_29345 [Actinobacteria bacterium]|nr:hypothetical protein [Actinomycetota bacterium]
MYEFLHGTNQARWLLENALTTLVYEEGAASTPFDDSNLGATKERPRQLALAVLDRHFGREQEPFLELLAHISEEYIVLAGLDSSKREHYLEYRPPILPASSSSPVRSGFRRLRRTLCPTGREFVLRYTTPLPRNLDSYHVTVEADEQIRIREAILTTDHADPEVRRLRSDMEELAKIARAGATPVSTKFYEYELQDAFGRLSDLVLQRASDLTRYEQYLQWRGAANARATLRPSAYRGGSSAFTQTTVETLVRLAIQFNNGELTQLAPSYEANAARLSWLADCLRSCELERDMVAEDDPREHAAHMYWRPRRPATGSSLPHPSAATVSVVFADDPPALAASVMRTMVALAFLTFALGTVLFRGVSWLAWSNNPPLAGKQFHSDAVIAILLLAPALLLNRLDLPRSNTLLGQLRLLPRALAISAVAVTGAVGVAIAGSDDAKTLQVAFMAGSATLSILAVVISSEMVGSWWKRRRSRDRVCLAPQWLYNSRGARQSRRQVDADFTVTKTV